MTKEGGTGGTVAALLLEGRKSAGLNQSQLAERAKVSRSRIIAAESRAALPTLDLCLKLANALGIPAASMFHAHAKDYLRETNPGLLTELAPELSERRSHWENIADHHGLRIEHGRYVGMVNDQGDLTVTRKLSGCFATRPRQVIFFRDRIIGERPPDFAVKGSPKGLGLQMNVSIEGEWAQHRLEFPRLWMPEHGPFHFEFETFLQKAFVLDRDEHNRRRKTEGLAPLKEWRGDFRAPVSYAFEVLELTIVFPPSYRPAWGKPTATWGTAPLSDYDFDGVNDQTCRQSRFKPGTNEATLTLERPVPGFTFGIRWTPDPEWMPVGTGAER